MAKKKEPKSLEKLKDFSSQVSFNSDNSNEAEMDQDIEVNDSKVSYSNKEVIEAQVDSLRLLNQVNIDMDTTTITC